MHKAAHAALLENLESRRLFSAAATTATVTPINLAPATPLTNLMLSGTATAMVNGQAVNVAGTFTFAGAAGTVLSAGNGQSEAVNFTPTDTTNYTTASTTVNVNVAVAPAVSTGAAGSISLTGATLNAIVNPQGPTTSASFEYSTNPSFTPTVASGTTIGAGFFLPTNTAVDAAGNVFVADYGHNAVKEVLPDGTIKTIATGFNGPFGIAVDGADDVYVADKYNNAIKEILPDGTVRTIGSGFSLPEGVAVDASGNVFVADYAHSSVSEVLANGSIKPIGSGFANPYDVAVDSAGNVYVADTFNNAVKEVLPDGTVKTLASGFNYPQSLAVDAAGDVYVYIADTGNNSIKEILHGSNAVVTVASGFNQPYGVSADAAGNLFVADTFNSKIIELPAPSIAAVPSPLTGTTATAVSATLTSLTPGTTYYYRVVSTSASDTVVGATNSFTTLAVPTVTVTSGNSSYNASPYVPATTVSGSVGVDSSAVVTYSYYVGSDTSGTSLGATAPTSVGTYTVVASFAGDSKYVPGTSAPTTFKILQATPTITDTAPAAVVIGTGAKMNASATLSGGYGETGFITFTLTAPGGSVVDSEAVAVSGNGVYTTPSGFLPTTSGIYQWTATYGGDISHKSVTSASNSAPETAVGAGVTTVGSALYLVGGAGSDQIYLGHSCFSNTSIVVLARLNGANYVNPATPTPSAIYIVGFNGNDNVFMDDSLAIPTSVSDTMGGDNIHLGGGNNTIAVGSGCDNIQAGDGNNVVSVTGTGTGNDQIELGNGNNTVTAGNGRNEQVSVGFGNNVITLGNGDNDVVTTAGCNSDGSGDENKSQAVVHAGNNIVTMGSGNNDQVSVGDGNNIVVMQSTPSTTNDHVQAGNGSNLIVGGLGRENIHVGNGRNILIDGSVQSSASALVPVLSAWTTSGASAASSIRASLSVTYSTANKTQLKAGSGLDWFWFTNSNDQTNRKPTDLLN